MSFKSIINRGEFFSDHYLEAVIAGDLDDLRRRWADREGVGVATARSRIRSMSRSFYAARGAAAEAVGASRAEIAAEALNDVVLEALGFPPQRTEHLFVWTSEHTVTVPAAHVSDTSIDLLVVLDAGFAADVDELFSEAVDSQSSLLTRALHRSVDNKQVTDVPDAIGELFGTDDPPRYVLVVAGAIVLLAERAKWAEGRYLAVDLDGALERNDTKVKGELETVAALFSADVLVPDDGRSVLDELSEKSHRHAVGVSQELRNRVRESVEILANEVIQQLDTQAQAHRQRLFSRSDVDPADLTRQCLRYLYRLLVLLYAESRPELGILPANDDAYMSGYSLDRLRELVVDDLDPAAQEGSHLDESLRSLFALVNDGYHADLAVRQLFAGTKEAGEDSVETYLQFPGLHAALFEQQSTALLNRVTLRNKALHRVLRGLVLAPGNVPRTVQDSCPTPNSGSTSWGRCMKA